MTTKGAADSDRRRWSSTDDYKRDYLELKRRGVKFEGEPKTMPYGTGEG